MRSRKGANIERLIDSKEALSTDEQLEVVEYFAANNNFTNTLFLVVMAVLHGVAGGIYVILALSKERTLVFLSNSKSPSIVEAAALFVCGALLLVCGSRLAMFAKKIRMGVNTNILGSCAATRAQSVERERQKVVEKFSSMLSTFRVSGVISLIPAVFWLWHLDTFDALEVLVCVWQPLFYFGMFEIVIWMRDSQFSLLSLQSTTYTHEKA